VKEEKRKERKKRDREKEVIMTSPRQFPWGREGHEL
jgi:hypothetical protein